MPVWCVVDRVPEIVGYISLVISCGLIGAVDWLNISVILPANYCIHMPLTICTIRCR